MSDAELHGLLSALLDGELSADEERAVRAYLERSAEARADLDALTVVRSLVRELPAVDAPLGFYEQLLRPARRARRSGPAAGSAFLAAAAAIIVIVGLTPVADRVVPPVNAYADRHMHMITPPAPGAALPGTGTAPGGSTLPGSTVVSGPPGTVAGASGRLPTIPVREPASGAFVAVPDTDLDHLGAPAQVGGTYQRMGGYQSDRGVLHVMYTNGAIEISIYEQSGTVAWDSLPSAGTRMQLGDDDAWAMDSEQEEVMVVERESTVYTVIAIGGHDDMVNVVRSMPPAPPPSMMDRAQQACRSVVEHFGFEQ